MTEPEWTLGRAGWVRYRATDDGPVVYLRYWPDSRNRWTLRELFIDSEGGQTLTAATLVGLPLEQIEANVNAQADWMRRHLHEANPAGGPESGSNVAVLASWFATATGRSRSEPDTWLMQAARDAALNEPTAKRQQSTAGRRLGPDGYRLPAGPRGSRLTDDFLRTVARAYLAAVSRGEAPNKAIHSEVPYFDIRTVEYWVSRARKLGMLPPGQKGRRG